MLRERLRDGYSGYLMLVITLLYPAIPIGLLISFGVTAEAGEPNPFYLVGAILTAPIWIPRHRIKKPKARPRLTLYGASIRFMGRVACSLIF